MGAGGRGEMIGGVPRAAARWKRAAAASVNVRLELNQFESKLAAHNRRGLA